MSVIPSTARVGDPLRLLVVEDSEPDAGLLIRELQRQGIAASWRRVWTADGLVNALRDATWDLVISDYAMPGFGGLEALALVIDSGLDLPFILVSGTIGEDIAVSAMRAGAHDYLLKDHLARLGAAIDRELREAGQRQARRRAEADARAAQSALQLHTNALNAAANAILITDADGHIEWVNPAFCALTGFTLEECLGRDPGELQRPAAHDPALYAQMWDTILAGDVWQGELVNCRKDGTTYHEEQTITPVTGAAGRIEHFIGVKQDITARKRADERIRQQASLLDAVNDAIYVTAVDGRVVSWNRSADALHGFSSGGSTRDVCCAFDAAALDAAHAVVLAAGTWSGEFPFTDAGGRALTLLSRWTLLRDDAGLATGVLRIDADITERKLLEQQFLRAQRMEAIGSLASGIAHDLNNVLAPTLMLTPLLRDALPDADNRGMLDTIEQCAQRGADIVRQLLTFARGEPGARVALPIRHLLRDLDKIVRETFPRSIRVTTRTPSELWTAEGDATQVHQVLLNLCINARDAMPEGGDLVLSADHVTLDDAAAARFAHGHAGAFIRLSVTDSGSGIAPEHLERIFDPFFTTKEVGKGTGLGLSTVLGIVRGHGGFVEVSSHLGRGTSFDVYLPAAATAAATVRAEAADTARGNGEVVLVVDDEPGLRNSLRRTLVGGGYRVVVAEHGRDGLEQFARHAAEIRAVLTDMMMPVMNGPALLEALRATGVVVPIVGMTGLFEPQGPSGGVAFSATLAKPFSRDALFGVLQRLLAPPS